METALKQASYQDIIDLPDNVVGEILDGQLYASPRPGPKHSVATSSLGMDLSSPFQFGRNGGPGGWWILDEPELHIGEQVIVPDIAGWRKDRMPTIPGESFFTVEPDWVCEVLSPSTMRIDRTVKMPLYARVGVAHIWLVDPDPRILEAFELKDERWVLLETLSEDEMVKVAPFDAIDFSLSDLWA